MDMVRLIWIIRKERIRGMITYFRIGQDELIATFDLEENNVCVISS